MLLGIMLLTSYGKTDHQDQASGATEQTSGDSRQTTEEPAETVGGSEESTEAAGTTQAAAKAVESTESSEYAERKSIIISHKRVRHRHWDVFCDRSDQRRTVQYQCDRRWTVCFHAGRVASRDHRFSVGAL